jgi:type IV pilus assembly protein PilY1
MKYLQKYAIAALLTGATCFNLAWSAVSQEPLLNKSGSVRPNLALILDTSGSMDWECAYSKHVTDAFLKDGYTNNYPGLHQNCLDSSDIRQVSPVNNLLYYNPKKTYQPGYVKGVLQGNASVGDSSVVKLYLPIPPKDPRTYTTSANIKLASNYDSYEITTSNFKKNGSSISGTGASSNPFGAHGGSRTDCAGDPCTWAEERKNVANWRKYHLDRIATAKTGLSAAFTNQLDNFRLAYTTIYGSPNTMTDWGVAKSGFFTWLDGRTASGGTPLRTALDDAGKYFQSTSNTGPWGSQPWSPPSGEKATDHLSCRKSYTIMITDGFYNDSTAPSPGEVDTSTSAPTHKYALTATTFDSNKTYQYKPGNTADQRNLGKSDSTTSSGGNSNTLADIAMKYWVTDLRSDLLNNAGNGNQADPPFWQNMVSYMVSFGAPGLMSDSDVETKAKKGTMAWVKPVANSYSAIDDMRHAAHNSGGDYLKVTDANQFAKDLGNVIGSIASQELSQAGVAASAVTLTAGTKKFVPYYTNGSWWGNLQMTNLTAAGDSAGIVWQVISTDVTGQPNGVTTIPTPASRKIVVWNNASAQGIDFNFTNVTAAGNSLKGTNANMQLSNAVTTDQIDYLRGVRTKEGNPYRKRLTILGDIVNSTPVFIKNNTNPGFEKLPTGTPGLTTFATYMATKAARLEGALLVGANDGMLHAFAEGYASNVGGRELFAYVPRSVLGKLEALTNTSYTLSHKFTVDGPLAETDVYTGSGWKNIVVGTTGAGARALFAIDVSNPVSYSGKSILWEINADPAFPQMSGNSSTSFQELGHVLSPVQSGTTVSGDWVSIFGNGYDSKSGKASLFIVETATGKLLREIATDTKTGNGLGGVRLVLNDKNQIIGAYAGDLQGRVWKFELGATSSGGWALGNGGAPIFTAMSGSTPLPITAQPAVLERTDQPSFKPSYLVSVATGKLFEIGDNAAGSLTNVAYGIWDKYAFGATSSGTVADSSLEVLKAAVVTSGIGAGTGTSINAGGIIDFYTVGFADPSIATTGMDWSKRDGWKLPLDVFAGQRDVYPVQMVGKVVKFDTVAPGNSGDSCKTSTSSALSFLIDPLSASCRTGGTLDTNGDGKIDKDDANTCAYTTNADGMDVVLNVLDAVGKDTGIKDIQNSTGHIKVRTGDGEPPPPDCSDPTYAAAHVKECEKDCSDHAFAIANPQQCCEVLTPGKCGPAALKNRTWRQLFPRAN